MLSRFISPLVVLIAISFGCTEKEATEQAEPELVKIDTLFSYTNFDTHNIAQPTSVKILRNGMIAVADYGQQTISLLNSKGDLITTFGREGRGPGEFLNIRDILEIEDEILVYDSHQNTLSIFDYDGELIGNKSFSSSSMRKETALISGDQYVIGTEGLNGHLLQMQHFDSDSVFSFGIPKADINERVNMTTRQNQLKSGQIPDSFKNKVIIRSDGNRTYVFFEALSVMQTYDLKGNLIWERNIDLPHNEKIFAQVVESTKSHTNPRSIPALIYIRDMKIIEDNIFILTSRPLNEHQQLVKLSKKGEMKALYNLPFNHEALYDFDIEPSTQTVYFTSWSAGVVFKADLEE